MKPDKSKHKPFSVRKRIGSFRHAINGIRLAISGEHNMRIHLVAAIVVIIAGFYFKLSSTEWIALILAISFVFVAELFNSAIELLADFISPGHHVDIGKIKDISSGAVLVTAIAAVVTGTLVFWPHLKVLFEKY